jgi:hypothetical protein
VTVSRDWTIDFDEAAALRTQDGSLDRILTRPGGREQWEGALADARALAAPAAVWELVPVEEVRHGTVMLRGGACLAGGPIAEVMADAQELALAVCTVGEPLTDRIRGLQKSGLRLRAVLLDELASMAVDTVRQQVCHRLSAEAEAAGQRAGVSLSPGESEWPLSEQAVVFSLVDASAIGVSLASTLLMRPLKSLSLVVGMRRAPAQGMRRAPDEADGCDYCVIRDRCTWRHRRSGMGARTGHRAPSDTRKAGDT